MIFNACVPFHSEAQNELSEHHQLMLENVKLISSSEPHLFRNFSVPVLLF